MQSADRMLRGAIAYIKNRADRLILFFLPLALTIINSNWIFTPPTDNIPDPWFYFSYFRYFFDRAAEFPSTIHYFVERLTWIMPGYYVYRVFPPLIANHILHLSVYYIAVFSLYGTLSLLFHRRAAFIGALLFGGYPWFLRAAGWDYPDGTGVAHLCVLILLLTFVFEVKRHWKAVFFLTGVVHSSLIVTNLFWLGLIPSWAIYFLLLNSQKRKFNPGQLVLAAAYFLIGNFCLAGACGVFYYWATGEFFFLENTVRISFYLVDNSAINTEVMTYYGGSFPWWHALPAVVFLTASWTLGPSTLRQRVGDKRLLSLYLLFVLAYAWLILWHYVSNPVLIIFPYMSLVLPSLFLLLGALWADVLEKLSSRQFVTAGIAGVLAMTLPWLALIVFPLAQTLQGESFFGTLLGLALIACLGISMVRKKEAIFVGILLLGVFYTLTAENAHVQVADRNRGRDNFEAIIAASGAIDAYYPDHAYREFRLWFRADENYNTFFSLAAVYLHPWGSSLDEPVSGRKPHEQLSLSSKDNIRPNDRIVIVSSSADAGRLLAEARQALASRDLDITLENSRTVHKGNILFHLYFTRAVTISLP